MSPIQTDTLSHHLRARAVVPETRQVLITRLAGSEQEHDITSLNCQGFGRIRHFQLTRYPDWSPNPLPILPAARALHLPTDATLRAQVFQNAACNWRCWYCYVDFSRLAANQKFSRFFTAEELLTLYLQEEDHPLILDLTGGQPDIVPEWVYWTLEALEKVQLAGKVFVWSDDNLSNRYFWRYLSPCQRQYIARFPGYARVGCFKGYSSASFQFNTHAAPDLFHEQFAIYRDLLREGIDMYAYVTFTALPHADLASSMAYFVDELQAIHRNLPLRTVPLKIEVFTPTQRRVGPDQERALAFQYEVHNAWIDELHKRFTRAERQIPLPDVVLTHE